jgi:hypothetical protein
MLAINFAVSFLIKLVTLYKKLFRASREYILRPPAGERLVRLHGFLSPVHIP